MNPRQPRSRLTPARRQILNRLLDALLREDATGRQQALDRLARRVPRIHLWLEVLLAASFAPTRFLDTVFERVGEAARSARERPVAALPAGTRLGPWRILNAAGSGGMGTVYKAERADGAFRMVVAIKLIRLHQAALDEGLKLERQLLARLDHRNIARLIDGGASPDGQAYLVMEWVEGRDLDRFVYEAGPGLESRLDLFEQIAQAVAHAHQRRVVHGDLKPSNVRVTDTGRVRLVDFGVARLVVEGDDGASHPVRALTPAFSAPEQQAGEAASTQSDVWSLGVILFWLVTGCMPGDKAEAVIVPPGSIPRHRDLEAIVRRACAREPDARYAGVTQLLDEVRRYRNRYPVQARSHSRRLVLGRFVQRHRLATGLAGVVGLALCMAVAGAVWQAHQATLERDRAEGETRRALIAEEESGRLAGELQQVVDFQADRLAEIDPATMGLGLREEIIALRGAVLEREGLDGEEVARRLADLELSLAGVGFSDLARTSLDVNVLVPALDVISSRFEDQPLVQARLRQSLAVTARGLGLGRRALESQEQAFATRRELLGADHPDTLESLRTFAALYGELGRREEAEALHMEALERHRWVYGDDHPATLLAINNAGVLVNARGRHAEAEEFFREAMEGRRQVLGPDHPDTLLSAANLGAAISTQGRLEEAMPYYRNILDLRRHRLGEDHPDTLRSISDMGVLLARMEHFDAALEYYEKSLQGRRRVLGNTHPLTLQSINNMGYLLGKLDRHAEAAPFYDEAVAQARILLGQRHPNTLIYINNASVLYRDLGDLERAGNLAAEAVASGRKALAPGHWHQAVFLSSHGLVLIELGAFPEAEAALMEAWTLYGQTLGPDHDRTTSLLGDFVRLYEDWHRAEPGNGHDAMARQWQGRLDRDHAEAGS